jgi:hypothetical protein
MPTPALDAPANSLAHLNYFSQHTYVRDSAVHESLANSQHMYVRDSAVQEGLALSFHFAAILHVCSLPYKDRHCLNNLKAGMFICRIRIIRRIVF